MCLWNTFKMRYRSIKLDDLEKWPFQWPRSTRVKVNPQKSFPIWSSDTSNWKYILRGIQICQNKLTLLPFSRSYMGLKVMNVKSDPPFHGGHFGNDVITKKANVVGFQKWSKCVAKTLYKWKKTKDGFGDFFSLKLGWAPLWYME